MLKFTKDPAGFAEERMSELAASGRLVNLVSNGACLPNGGMRVPAPFGTWRSDKNAGCGGFGVDASFGEGDMSSLCATGAVRGCFLVTQKGVNPGECYAVKASAFGEGVSASVSWKDAKGKYVGRTTQMAFKGDAHGWRHGLASVRIPSGAMRIMLTLSVDLAEGEKAWFDNVAIYKLSGAPGPEMDPDR